jgi:hypothetical protein
VDRPQDSRRGAADVTASTSGAPGFTEASLLRPWSLHTAAAGYGGEHDLDYVKTKGMRAMKVNRRGLVLGFVGLGMAAALAGGIGIAQADPAAPAGPAAAAPAWGPGGMHGNGVSAGSCLTAAASYLGLSDSDLRAQLHAGKTLAQVAADRGKSVDGLKDAMLAAAKSNFDANTTLTAEQKAARLEQMKTWLDTMINQVHTPGAGMGAGMGPGMGRGMHGPGR